MRSKTASLLETEGTPQKNQGRAGLWHGHGNPLIGVVHQNDLQVLVQLRTIVWPAWAPLVNGVRVAGPLSQRWQKHTKASPAGWWCGLTHPLDVDTVHHVDKTINIADAVIILVDNANRSTVASSTSYSNIELVSSGNSAKLIFAFTIT